MNFFWFFMGALGGTLLSLLYHVGKYLIIKYKIENIIKKTEEFYTAHKKLIDTNKKEFIWFDVNEFSPLYNVKFLIQIIDQYGKRRLSLGYFCCRLGWDFDEKFGYHEKVTHWMFIPYLYPPHEESK